MWLRLSYGRYAADSLYRISSTLTRNEYALQSLPHDAWLEETRLPALYRTFLDLGQIDPEWRKLPVQTRAQRMLYYKSHWILYFIRRLSKHKNRTGRLIAYNFRDLPGTQNVCKP